VISVIVAATEEAGGTSHISHFYGGLGGLLIGFCVLQNLIPEKWEEKLQTVSLTTYSVLLLIGFACLFNMFGSNVKVR
jgi:hypothetical protein